MVKGTIDSLVYQEIVDGYLLPTMGTLYPEGWFLQQDNAPCHVSESSMAFFKKREIEVMDWPPNGPDLNPIENFWTIFKKGWLPLQERLLQNGRLKSRKSGTRFLEMSFHTLSTRWIEGSSRVLMKREVTPSIE